MSSDTVLSVRATVLLGQVLHLATLLLPHEIGSVSQCLPELAEHIATNTQVIKGTFFFQILNPQNLIFIFTTLRRSTNVNPTVQYPR